MRAVKTAELAVLATHQQPGDAPAGDAADAGGGDEGWGGGRHVAFASYDLSCAEAVPFTESVPKAPSEDVACAVVDACDAAAAARRELASGGGCCNAGGAAGSDLLCGCAAAPASPPCALGAVVRALAVLGGGAATTGRAPRGQAACARFYALQLGRVASRGAPLPLHECLSAYLSSAIRVCAALRGNVM